LLKKIISLNMASSGLFLLMISTAFAADGRSDPVLHALVLTGIVIAVSTTGFALVLAGRLWPPPGSDDAHKRP
jgi:multicomponent Na+:H+ antiporter subunit C